MNYKEYQLVLKSLKSNGFDVQVKLNSKLKILQEEYAWWSSQNLYSN